MIGESKLNIDLFLQSLRFVETYEKTENFIKFTSSGESNVELWRPAQTTFYHANDYFDRMALYDFQAIITVCSNRFTEGDTNVAKSAEHFGIPVAFVRQIAAESQGDLYEQTKRDFKNQGFASNIYIFVLTSGHLSTQQNLYDNAEFLQWLQQISSEDKRKPSVESDAWKDSTRECHCPCPSEECRTFEEFLIVIAIIFLATGVLYYRLKKGQDAMVEKMVTKIIEENKKFILQLQNTQNENFLELQATLASRNSSRMDDTINSFEEPLTTAVQFYKADARNSGNRPKSKTKPDNASNRSGSAFTPHKGKQRAPTYPNYLVT